MLKRMMPTSSVSWENSRVIVGGPSLQPDICITANDRSPIVIEAEHAPGRDVETDARQRIGLRIVNQPHPIESAIAVIYPPHVAVANDVSESLRESKLEYCVHSEDGTRFPARGWINGSVADIADLARLEAIPKRAATEASEHFQLGIDLSEPILLELEKQGSGTVAQIAAYLGMTNVEQTRRMACAIVLNAIVFHEHLAAFHQFDPFSKLVGDGSLADKQHVIKVWDEILEIDYWPIFATARTVANELPSPYATRLFQTLYRAASKFTINGLNNSHDLTGRVFQRLISDRQYLATYYTLPASATLLAKLALAKVNNVDWSDTESVSGMRVADFACGTGALLSAVYEEAANRFERTGSDHSTLHAPMLERVLTGCDVMPSAVHITGSTLSGMQPSQRYSSTNLYTMPYGRRGMQEVAIGSLELLDSTSVLALFNTSAPALRAGPQGEGATREFVIDVPDHAFDVVIMNPPYTSNTKHRDADDGVRAAAFAAFATTTTDQSDMAAKLREKANGTSYHGHAGLGSAFAALADAKVKPGGVIAFVLPLTALNGSGWRKFRSMLVDQYTDMTVVSLTGDDGKIAFSSDTSIAECLIIARKLKPKEKPSGSAEFVALRRRPENIAQATVAAKSLIATVNSRTLEDGPHGGDSISVGDDVVGEVIRANIDDPGSGFDCARLRDAAVGQSAAALAGGTVWLPGMQPIRDIPLVQLYETATRGPDSQMFIGHQHKGPFVKRPADENATYPALWNRKGHDEPSFIYQADAELTVKPGMEARADELWQTASRFHIAREFGFNQDITGAVYTERATVGGRSWPSIMLPDPDHEPVLVLWCNSILGLLSYWWASSRQQGARGSLTITQMGKLIVPDVTRFAERQITAAQAIFDEFRGLELKPAHMADIDPNRAKLDRAVICDMLELGGDVYEASRLLARKWCAEPSVHGGRGQVAGIGVGRCLSRLQRYGYD